MRWICHALVTDGPHPSNMTLTCSVRSALWRVILRGLHAHKSHPTLSVLSTAHGWSKQCALCQAGLSTSGGYHAKSAGWQMTAGAYPMELLGSAQGAASSVR
jgi:hypothetical protein